MQIWIAGWLVTDIFFILPVIWKNLAYYQRMDHKRKHKKELRGTQVNKEKEVHVLQENPLFG